MPNKNCGNYRYKGGLTSQTSTNRQPKTSFLIADAKAYILNMTMLNGEYGCSTCEEPGVTERQGKGYARFYPYRESNVKPQIRSSEDVKYFKGPNATKCKRLKGSDKRFIGKLTNSSRPWKKTAVNNCEITGRKTVIGERRNMEQLLCSSGAISAT
ncbi:unnamed protein product [Mytilus edulis]|uniref:Uncharacterized protein n=1 Tax=Mytilus edulis TaxID=6550 RepID=A0A8S3TYG6_MYTED|nr:unnamed protein product [Mytilus edulis]